MVSLFWLTYPGKYGNWDIILITDIEIKYIKLFEDLEKPRFIIKQGWEFIWHEKFALLYKIPVVETSSNLPYTLWNLYYISGRSSYTSA